MKSYNEVANDVFRRRDEYVSRQRRREAVFHHVAATMSAAAVVLMVLLSAGTCYVVAASFGIIDDFLGIFSSRTGTPLSSGQEQYIENAVAKIGESVTCNGYTVTAQGAFTDGTVAYVLLDVEAPEGVAIEGLNIFFDTDAKEIIRGDNPDKYLDITGLQISTGSVADNDGKENTASVLIQISCVRLNGSDYSFADGYARYLVLTDIFDRAEEYPWDTATIAEGTWEFEILFNEVQEGEVELLTTPLHMQIQRITVTDYVDAVVSSIRLKGMGVVCYYTIDAGDIQEPGDFGNIQIVMKDGSVVYAYPRSATSVGNDTVGNKTFCCYYISEAPIVFVEVDYVTIGEDVIIPMPLDHSLE